MFSFLKCKEGKSRSSGLTNRAINPSQNMPEWDPERDPFGGGGMLGPKGKGKGKGKGRFPPGGGLGGPGFGGLGGMGGGGFPGFGGPRDLNPF